jgi:ATP-dependent DNA ligase
MHTCGKTPTGQGSDKGYALRFPRMIKLREQSDKKAENSTTTEEVKKMYSNQKRVSLEDNPF